MSPTPLDPHAHLSLRDCLELLAFEARLAGFTESLIQAVWEALDVLHVAERKANSESRHAGPNNSG